MRLTTEAVANIFKDCLFRDGESTENHVPAEGIVTNVGFHPERLQSHASEVRELLMELPEAFRESRGGGWTFLNAACDKHGVQWGEHRNMEQLFLLGIGLGLVRECMPGMRAILPGGMPYYVILDGADTPQGDAS